MGHNDPHSLNLPQTLEECHALIRLLREENAALRQSGADFGLLAERLNVELQEERRLGGERRGLRRSGDDRRADATPAPHEKTSR